MGAGQGSGLHYTRKVILAMNGEISFETNDSGTNFLISLPAYSQRAIILEDNLEKLQRYKRTLNDLSIKNFTFSTPDTLLESFDVFLTSDIFILDYDLNSEKNGLDIALHV